MYRIVKMTYGEKVKMYKKLSKRRLIDMHIKLEEYFEALQLPMISTSITINNTDNIIKEHLSKYSDVWEALS